MKNSDKNRDPERAVKRAASDLRSAVRKLGYNSALELILEMAAKDAGVDANEIMPGNHTMIGSIGRSELAGLILAGGGYSVAAIAWEKLV